MTAAPAAPPQWRPIETAPRDGTHVLLWSGGEVIIGWFETGRNVGGEHFNDWTDGSESCGGYDCGYHHIAPPTHWMPLPEPPDA